jgi:hypothetical protein
MDRPSIDLAQELAEVRARLETLDAEHDGEVFGARHAVSCFTAFVR